MIISQYSFWPLVLFSQQKIFSQWLKITSKSLNFMTERAKRAPLIFKDFAPKINIFYIWHQNSNETFKVIFKTLCIHAT